MWGLNRFQFLRAAAMRTKWLYFTRFWGMDIDRTARFSLSARIDRTFPHGIHIGAETYVAFEAAILSHDLTRGLNLHTRIGRRCFIGARSIILPGVEVGDESVVGAGAVVTRNVPPRSVVAGNPARIIRKDIEIVSRFGRLADPDDNPAGALEEAPK